MDNDKYIESLENLLIFMCQTYDGIEKALLDMAKEGNDALFKVPRIQGIYNTVPIAQLAVMKFNPPEHGFGAVKDIIHTKRLGKEDNNV